MYDLMGKDATLFHHAATEDDTSTGTQYVEQAKLWSDSMWNTVSGDASRGDAGRPLGALCSPS
jgi:hypothetical protein